MRKPSRQTEAQRGARGFGAMGAAWDGVNGRPRQRIAFLNKALRARRVTAMADSARINELETRLRDLQNRWPAHSVPPAMLQELERLEDQLEEARQEER